MSITGMHPVSLHKTVSRKWLKTVLQCWQLYILLLPAFIYFLIFNYYPMYGVQIAFRQYRTNLGFWGSPWIGLGHFRRFITFPNFWKIIRNTMVLSAYTIAVFPLAVIVALLINELTNSKFKRAVQMVTYAPHFISTVVVCSMIMLFLNNSNGIINNLISTLGGERVDFMMHPRYFPHVYVWSGVWQNIGWSTIIYLAALSSVSPELIEASRIDGANRLQIILHVNIPTILPTIVIMLILSCGNILSVGFEKVYLLQNPLNKDAAQVISTYVYEVGLQGAQFSYSTAIGLFNTVINVTVLLIVNTVTQKITNIGLW